MIEVSTSQGGYQLMSGHLRMRAGLDALGKVPMRVAETGETVWAVRTREEDVQVVNDGARARAMAFPFERTRVARAVSAILRDG